MADCTDTPDWAFCADPMREAMDHEEGARYDRFDGWGDPDDAEEWADKQEYDALSDAERRANDAEIAEIQAEADRARYDGYDDVPF